MLISLLFWLALLAPGYAIARRLSDDDLDSGLPGAFALSTFYALAALAPLAIVCYVARAPAWVFSGACLAFIIGGAAQIVRHRWWKDIRALFIAGLTIELAILLIDAAMGARAGSFYTGDALTHLARVRFLLDHGYSNTDPFLGEPYFWPIYHTNLLHALLAAATQLTGLRSIDVWVATLPWAKLFVASCAYLLAWNVFRSRVAAWLAAVTVAASVAHSTILIYPNRLVPLALMPLALAFAVQALRGEGRRIAIVKLALASLLVGQLHGLYALFLVAFAAPVLFAIAGHRLLRERSTAMRPLLCALALCAGLPFPIISAMTRAAPDAPTQTVISHDEDDTPPSGDGAALLEVGEHMVMRNPNRGFFSRGLRPALLALACGLCVFGPRRRDSILPVGFALCIVATLLVPPLCTLALRVFREEWILLRAEGLLPAMLPILLVPSVVVLVLAPIAERAWFRAALAVALIPGFIFLNGTQQKLGDYVHDLWLPAQRRFEILNKYRKTLRTLGDFIPPGERIVCPIEFTPDFVSRFDVHTITSWTTSVGAADLPQRTRDNAAMLDPTTSWNERRALLEQYGARHYIVFREDDISWADGHIARIDRSDDTLILLELKLD